MMAKRMNVIKLAIVGLIFSINCLTKTHETQTPKNINWGNAAKATLLSGASILGVWSYYMTIVKPYVIDMARKRGLDYAIEFNKNFIMQNPAGAVLNAMPLVFAACCAVVAHDYAKNIKTEDIQ